LTGWRFALGSFNHWDCQSWQKWLTATSLREGCIEYWTKALPSEAVGCMFAIDCEMKTGIPVYRQIGTVLQFVVTINRESYAD